MVENRIAFVIALVGQKAAGKSEAARYFQQIAQNPFGFGLNFAIFRPSDPLYAIAKERGIEQPSTLQLQHIGNELRSAQGPGALAIRALELAAGTTPGATFIIIDGVRNPGEISEIRRIANDRCVFVGIRAHNMIRCSRFQKRERERFGRVITRTQFQELDRIDMGLGQQQNGQRVGECLSAIARDQIICNNGDLWQFKHRLHCLWINKINAMLLAADE